MKKIMIALFVLLTAILLFVGCQNNETCRRYCLTTMINSADVVESLTALNRVGSGIAELVTEERNGRAARFLRRFNNSIGNSVSDLAKTLRNRSIQRYLVTVQNLDNEIATEFLDQGEHAYVTNYLTMYSDLSENTAARLIDDGYGRDVALHIPVFRELDERAAYRLIEAGHGKHIISEIASFGKNLDHLTIVNRFFDAGDHEFVAGNLQNFEVDHQWVADRIIAAQQIPALGRNLRNFRNLNSETAEILAIAGFARAVVENMYPAPAFTRLNNRAAEAIIRNGRTEEVAKKLEAFEELNDAAAKMLINSPDDGNSYAQYVASKLGRIFRGLSEETAQELIRRGYRREVQENPQSFAVETVDTHRPNVSIVSTN